MKNKRRMEVTFETHEVTIIRFGRSRRIFCETCRQIVPHVALEGVASMLPETELARLLGDGQIHTTLSADGRHLFCGDSLAAVEENNQE